MSFEDMTDDHRTLRNKLSSNFPMMTKDFSIYVRY